MNASPFTMARGRTCLRAALLLPLLPLALLGACDSSSKKGESPKTAAAKDAQAQRKDPTLVTASAEMQRELVVKPVATAPISHTERIAGHVDFDQYRVARIGANVTGRVTQLHVTRGESVKAGDLLAQLNSTELGTSQLNYLSADARAKLNLRNVERARQLLAADVIGSAELQKRESELEIAEAEKRAAAEQLRVQGMSAGAIRALGKSGTINSTSQIIATAPGVVVEHKVALGQVTQPADMLFTIADLSRVWVVAEVPEQQINGIKTGQSVQVEVPALGDKRLEGKLVYVGATVDAERRTVTVRTELDNPERMLKPAMLATMLIASRPVDTLAVPAGAVVRENDEDHVLQDEGNGRFRMVKVKLGPEFAGVRPVESGLKADDRVVAEGAFHLNNERKRMLLSE
jgi:cobalt-zinc-cadmium efflux system membrane fusion protein